MSILKKSGRISGALLLLVSCLRAFAADVPPSAPVLSQGSVSYMSGGVGDDELEMMQQLASKFNLKMLFASTKGNYLAGVHITVENKGGQVLLNTDSDGPFLYVLLPKGQCKVVALKDNQPIVKTVHLSEKGNSSLIFRWAEPEKDVGPSPKEKSNM
jgi:hypothetical protein